MNTVKYEYEDFEIQNLLTKLDLNGYDSLGGTDKAKGHNYTGLYANLLKNIRNNFINFVEIGILHGGSMALWANYLPNAKFLFFDITNQIKPKAEKYFDLNRMKFEIGDAYTKISQEVAQKHFSEGIDFLVDDGPHTLDSMVSCIKIYSPLMKSGGVIVIEDVQSYDWFNVLERESPKNCIFEAVDVRRDPVVYDDMVAVLKF